MEAASTQERLANVAKAYEAYKKKGEAKLYEGSLLEFSEYVWPVVEPAIPMIRGWAMEAICEHLEAVTAGHIKRLLMNVPPGFSKSLLTDVFWPAWEWGPRNMPWLRYVCASYSNHLTERDNMRCRNIVMSERYQRLWKSRFGISNEQFTKIKFANDKTGWKLATSVGGIGVGERGDRFIIDDPNNTMEMESQVTRDTTNMWFTEVVPDRLNNQTESAIVVIQQRLHEDDVSGTALSRDMGYTHLMIPMEHDSARHCVTVLGIDEDDNEVNWEDPRIDDGILAWPERFPEEACRALERDKGPYAWAGQYQQSPEPRGGAIIKRDFWKMWEEAKFPPCEYILASLDSAYTEKQENDPSALTVWGVFRHETVITRPARMGYNSDYYNAITNNVGEEIETRVFSMPKVILLYAWQDRLPFPELMQRVIDTCTVDSRTIGHPRFPIDRLIIEAKASGMSVAQEMRSIFAQTGRFGVELIPANRGQDKVARVHSIQHLFSEGMVYAPDKSWADMVIDQCAVFPKSKHDDLVDSTSMALRYLRDNGFALRREEQVVASEEEIRYKPQMPALYPV